MTTTTSSAPGETLEQTAYRKVTWRLIPFLFLCYVVAYLDRVNVGFAKLQMLSDLQFSETVYGLGAGIFFIGYFLFEVPSNMILHRTGARVWIARIMVTWGVISSAMMFVTTPTMFYVLRFILGVAEAGFFPGIILYLTYWFPSQRRARVVALFMTAIAVSGVVGGPLSGWIMQAFAGMNGWKGWQWLFLLEGLPSVLMGVAVFFYLDDRIADAKWLTADEKRVLSENIARDEGGRAEHSISQVFGNPKVWLMAGIYFCFIMGLYGISFWLPQLIKAAGVSNVLDVGLLTSVPYGLAAVAMVLASRSSDRTGERRWHTATAGFVGGIGLVLSGIFGGDVVLAMASLSLATMGILSSLPLFWTLPTGMLRGAAAAAGIAMINAFGNLAGFVSPFMVGSIKDATGSTTSGLYVLAASLVLGGVLVLLGARSASATLPAGVSPSRG
ncbi:MFS transporter [Pseudorhodoferax sp. Leaf267]|uniref:MFS transporter n=1 Tax=Pseudorhodoferax sp. Leaf267 TaxID=1736316 RepID=UPI0006F758A7|nr:MFS transporter [Pseudorhodoferax sp. Leaf267]KQP12667.1 MFS transporter [Pseudorhodoferax sp. Leaf267]